MDGVRNVRPVETAAHDLQLRPYVLQDRHPGYGWHCKNGGSAQWACGSVSGLPSRCQPTVGYLPRLLLNSMTRSSVLRLYPSSKHFDSVLPARLSPCGSASKEAQRARRGWFLHDFNGMRRTSRAMLPRPLVNVLCGSSRGNGQPQPHSRKNRGNRDKNIHQRPA
jgi:hypothetical protein